MDDAELRDPAEGESVIERARRKLYDPTATSFDLRGTVPPPAEQRLPGAWKEEAAPQALPMKRPHKHIRLATLFLIIAAVFFVGSAGVAAYVLYFGGNSVSTNNVDLAVTGPTTIRGGDTVPFSITITNRNPTPLNSAALNLDFPSGTRSAGNVLQDYPRYTEDLGTIAPGQTITRTVKATLFGAEGQSISIPVSFSFGTENSNATFVKKTSYDLSITSSPLALSVSSPAETVSGKLVTFTLSIRSNATTPVSNIVVAATYPFGFSLASSSVPVQNGNFIVGTLKPGDTQTFTLTGTLSGSDNSQRTFHFTLGTAKSDADPTLAIAYLSQEADVSITTPFITTTLAVNGLSTTPLVLTPGKQSSANVSFTNTLATAVQNAEVDVAISGGAIDYASIKTTSGFYRSSDHTVVFSRDTLPALANLDPGASGLGSFSFSTLAGQALKDPSVTFTISVSGTRIGQSNVPEAVTASQTVSGKVTSAVALTARSLHATGPITNAGSIPPKADTPTTYTIVWDLSNSGSTLADSVVTTKLPTYVTFTNVAAPSGAVSYNSATRTVTWNAGSVSASGQSEALFQVSITPSAAQRGSTPTLTSVSTFSGYDRYAGVQVSTTVDPVSTGTVTEPGYTATMGVVQ